VRERERVFWRTLASASAVSLRDRAISATACREKKSPTQKMLCVCVHSHRSKSGGGGTLAALSLSLSLSSPPPHPHLPVLVTPPRLWWGVVSLREREREREARERERERGERERERERERAGERGKQEREREKRGREKHEIEKRGRAWHLEVNGVLLKVGSQRRHFKDANVKIKACTQHLQKPGSRLSDNDRNAASDVAASFVSGPKVCYTTGARFTDQDCVSYVHHRILIRIADNKNKIKNKQDPKNNGGAGGRSLPHEVPFEMYVLYSLRGWVEGTYGDFFPAINPEEWQ
jgi:hypothetical protein